MSMSFKVSHLFARRCTHCRKVVVRTGMFQILQLIASLACFFVVGACSQRTGGGAARQCALSDDSRLSFAGADSQSNDCLSPNVEWLPRKGDLHLKCDGFQYMSERDSFRVDKNMATVRALYADDSDRYCFLFKVYHREDAGWREVGCGELSLRQQAAGYDVISESASSGIDVQLVGCNAAAGNGSEREGYRAQVEIEYGSYRCRFYLRPLSEL